MQVKILGPIAVWDADAAVELGGAKQRAVLAMLAINLGSVVSSQEIIEAVWGDELPSNPLNTLQYQIAQLRKILESDPSNPERLITRSPGYSLRSGAISLDASEFDSLSSDARTSLAAGDTRRAADLVDAALSIWRGPALADFQYDDFARGHAVRLDDARLSAEELSIDIALAEGRNAEALPRLAQLTIEHPFREGLWARQMTALYRDGQQTEALRAYQAARDALAEIGVEPAAELRRLEQQVLEHDPSLDGPEPRTAATPNNLPRQPNELIGREKAVADLLDRMRTSRLVTLTGPGGSGKTRLSIEAATRCLDQFTGGVWFVPLDQIEESSLVPAFVGRTIGIKENASMGVVDNIVAALGHRAVLLVLDNAEHITDAVADLAASLLARADGLNIVATSQAVLGIQGEVVFGVEPLTLPARTSSI